MPIDSSIALQARLPQFDNPLDTYSRVAQIKNFQNQNRLADLAFAEKERAAQFADKRRNALISALNQETGEIDPAAYQKGLAGAGDYEGLQTFQKDQLAKVKAQREAEKEQIASAKAEMELIWQVAGAAKDQQSYTAGLQFLQSKKVDTSGLPQQYDPAYVEQGRKQALSVLQQLDQVWKQKKFDLDVDKFSETKRSNRVTEGISRENLGVAQENLGLRREEIDIKRKESAGGVVPPKLKQGERWNAEEQRVEAVQGSDIYQKQSSAHGKDYAALLGVNTKMDSAIAKIDDILSDKNKSAFNSNFGGYNAYVSQYLPGDASNARKKIESIKSDLKSAGLEMMRSGGSIGQMTQQEWPIVEAMISRIDPVLGEETAREEFEKIKIYMENIKKNAAEAYSAEWGNSQFAKKSKPPTDAEPKRIKSDAEYNALPSGAEFIDPNGQKRRKP